MLFDAYRPEYFLLRAYQMFMYNFYNRVGNSVVDISTRNCIPYCYVEKLKKFLDPYLRCLPKSTFGWNVYKNALLDWY